MDWGILGIGLGIGILIGGLAMYLMNFFLGQKKHKAQVKQATELSYLQESFQSLKVREGQLQQAIQRQNGELNRLMAERSYLQERQQQTQEEQSTWKEEMRMQFEYLAQQVLDKKSSVLTESQEKQLFTILQPFKDQLHAFEKRIAETYSGEIRERIQLQKEIEVLVSLNQQLSEDAQNLTKALKGENKTQGTWGELILTRILESSGLREGKEFHCQKSYLHSNGKRIQPDVIITLPGKRHLVIDAKVSLTAYERWTHTEDNASASLFLSQHTESVQRHIKSLSEKYYQGVSSLNSPDFVFLFMAVEPAFSMAIQHRPELFPYAWERKIVLVSPSSMLATLKTVASVWKVEHQNQNAMEIARQGGLLYDKFVGFVEELEKIGKHIDRSSQAYHLVMQKLQNGQGNLIDKAERLKSLGATSQKQVK